MEVVYALQQPPDSYRASLFLAGPTPRSDHVASWRPQALRELKAAGFDGVVFVPEDARGVYHGDYDAQVSWEDECLQRSDAIVFWVPRDLESMPAFTTNVEFGRWEASGRVVLGAPPQAPRNTYLRHYAELYGAPTTNTLPDTIVAALGLLGDGAWRTGGERDVPLHIWRTDAFQRWYATQRAAGNALMGARVLWTFRPGGAVFSFALHVDVHVAEEDRRKTNEFVLARPDISTVVLYRPAGCLDDTEVVLVREFRSPARTSDGFVWELPGGSHPSDGLDERRVAVEECHEEIGVLLDPVRLRSGGSRQLAATFSSHHAHLYACELTEREMERLRRDETVRGVHADSERTTVHVRRVGDIRDEQLVDWSTLGMILDTLV